MDTLDAYFIPKLNFTNARRKFRECKSQQNETVLQYTVRLTALVMDGGYGNDRDNQIRDQVFTFCRDKYFQKRLAEENGELTLNRTLEIAMNVVKCNSV